MFEPLQTRFAVGYPDWLRPSIWRGWAKKIMLSSRSEKLQEFWSWVFMNQVYVHTVIPNMKKRIGI